MFPYKKVRIKAVVLFSFLLISVGVQAQDKNEEALSNSANELFQAQDFLKAKDAYSQLISLYPKNENYNYRFGACLLVVDKDKEFAIKFLEYAVTQPNVDKEAFYYMGKGYHLNLRFDEAIPFYKKYLTKITPKEKNVLPATDEIRYCQNGIGLLKDIKEPTFLGKSKVNASDFFVSIKIKPMGGRVLNAPKSLQSSLDKKKGYFPVMYVNTNTSEVYFSSYGNGGNTGLDIYVARVKSDGELDKAIKLSSEVNTPFDDSYPFMNEDETTFYFASKGHNSMGGYDIFKSDYNSDNQSFSSPLNMDYAINTPDNDYMYATVASEGYAFFASDRNCESGKVYVFKIDQQVNSVKSTVLTGVFSSKATKSCKITVTDLDLNEEVGAYSTNKNTGAYTMRLHQGGNYSFLVEPFGGTVAYKGNVKIPFPTDDQIKQEIEILAENGSERLIIRNLFGDQPVADTTPEENIEEPKEEVLVAAVEHNVEIDQEIEKTKKQIQTYIGEHKKYSNISYHVANEKRELAQQDLAMAEQLENTISLNDQSAENIKKQDELSQLMQDAQKHAEEAEAAFALGKHLDQLANDAASSLNKYTAYEVKISAAEKLDDGEKMQKAYEEFQKDDDLYTEQKISTYLATEIEEEEKKANSYIDRAEKVGVEQISIKEEISKVKVQQNSTKDPDEKDEYQLTINDLETELAPLENEKARLFLKAQSHSAKSQKLKDELATLNEYKDSGETTEGLFTEVSVEQKDALIASITATSSEIDALLGSTSDEMKIESPKGVSGSVGSADKEIVTGGLPDDVSTTETNKLANTEEEAESNSKQPEEATPKTDSKYFAYTDVYEKAVDDVVLIEGESIPLTITPSTGKKRYTPEQLAVVNVNIKSAPYQSTYQTKLNQTNEITSSKEKSKKTQKINYNWVTEIEKEIAVLTYAKSNSTNEEYNQLLSDKIKRLEGQAKQKRNFLALNARIIKQLDKEEKTAIESKETETKEEVDLSALNEELDSESDTKTTTVSKTKEIPQTTNDSEKVQGEEINAIGSETKSSTNINVPPAKDEEKDVVSNSKTNTAGVIEAQQTPGQVIIANVETDKKVQKEIVDIEKETLKDLQSELNSTKKKKDRAAKQQEIDQQTAKLKLEKERLKLTNKRLTELSNTLDDVVADPLGTRPSVAKYVEAQKLRNEYKALESQLGDLEDELTNTRKKKRKRAIQAEMITLESNIEFKRMQSEIALESAKEVEEVEVLVLKGVTKYGTEVLVKLPETEESLTPQEKEQTESLEAYQDYKKAVNLFEVQVKSADVLYQMAVIKSKAVEQIDAEIEQMNREVVNLPKEEQAEMLNKIEDAQFNRTRLVREAEVFYKQAKTATNDAYYGLNEANAKIISLPNAEERTKIIALVQGNIAESIPGENQKELLTTNEVAENQPENEIVDSNPRNSNNNDINTIPKKLNSDIFETSNETYYSSSNPIPVDVELPEGVVLKVQVGAFRNPISPEIFKGFAPIVAENTGTGLTRYTAGLFTDFNSANNAKAGIRSKGYSDAFVVAYLNGKRISISEARRLLGGEITASEVESGTTSPQPAPVTDVRIENVRVQETTSASSNKGKVNVASVQSRGDLYFTVQVGVYNSSVNPSTIFKITPLNSDPISGGLVRYSTGIYNSIGDAINARNRIVQMGISDAFVTAYSNGKRTTISEAKRIANEQGGVAITNPQTTPAVTRQPNNNNNNNNNRNEQVNDGTTATSPSSNPPNVNRTLTKGNYYVQIGPYSDAIPMAEARVLLSLTSLGVIVVKKSGTTMYKIGNFTDVIEANALRDDLKSKGLTDPEVVKSE